MEKIVHYYRKTEPSHSLLPSVKEELKALGLVDDSAKILAVETESCFNVKLDADLTAEQTQKLEWLLAETFDRGALCLEKSFLDVETKSGSWKAEFGPRMTFTSAFSSNASSICQACGLPITRLERSRRFRFSIDGELSEQAVPILKSMLHDRMTEEEYTKALTSFDTGAEAKPVKTVPIMEQGRAALEAINKEMGLGFDDFDLDYYTDLFKVSLFLVNRMSNVLRGIRLTPIVLSARTRHDRRNSDAILPKSSVSIWASPTQSTLVTGFSVER
jgi:phosphoribosylformylglycinamidine synthase